MTRKLTKIMLSLALLALLIPTTGCDERYGSYGFALDWLGGGGYYVDEYFYEEDYYYDDYYYDDYYYEDDYYYYDDGYYDDGFWFDW